VATYTILVITHVLLFAYWLGADWGVYVTARYVADPALATEERRRFLQAALRIDLLPRIAFTLLLPVGLQIAAFYGAWPIVGPLMTAVWLAALAWLGINVVAYRRIGTQLGERLGGIDQRVRIVLSPTLIATGTASVVVGTPTLPLFVALKLVVFGLMIVVGLVLRGIMRHWGMGFRKLATEGRSPEVDAMFLRTFGQARWIAYGMWGLSGTMAVLGVSRLV